MLYYFICCGKFIFYLEYNSVSLRLIKRRGQLLTPGKDYECSELQNISPQIFDFRNI